ncbi:uncharacterized protein TA02780 [Theileria annulata]|uniref:Uncharacterized protein n=1 Tax=Theileria annulata TaxID=5874 RepID=Q4UHL8_THEAN|nr:uncharacterized protein TA02780 [Theileria annulata]CAI73421.1 hypothetical protein TA02780 [Theileria annulata]|eukprot:XP_954098.1 hypothetical protein TA02780 [Theileria annulata]
MILDCIVYIGDDYIELDTFIFYLHYKYIIDFNLLNSKINELIKNVKFDTVIFLYENSLHYLLENISLIFLNNNIKFISHINNNKFNSFNKFNSDNIKLNSDNIKLNNKNLYQFIKNEKNNKISENNKFTENLEEITENLENLEINYGKIKINIIEKNIIENKNTILIYTNINNNNIINTLSLEYWNNIYEITFNSHKIDKIDQIIENKEILEKNNKINQINKISENSENLGEITEKNKITQKSTEFTEILENNNKIIENLEKDKISEDLSKITEKNNFSDNCPTITEKSQKSTEITENLEKNKISEDLREITEKNKISEDFGKFTESTQKSTEFTQKNKITQKCTEFTENLEKNKISEDLREITENSQKSTQNTEITQITEISTEKSQITQDIVIKNMYMECEKLRMKRFVLLEKIKENKIFGIITIKPYKNNNLRNLLQKILETNNCKFVQISINNLTENKLFNFQNINFFILLTNNLNIINFNKNNNNLFNNNKLFNLILPYELLIGFNIIKWTPYIFDFNIISSVTVSGPTESNGPDNRSTGIEDTKNTTKDPIGASTVMEENSTIQIAAPKVGTSTTNTLGKGANFTAMECTTGKGANFTATKCTMGKGANFTAMECTTEKNTNKVAAVTKTRESGTNSNTKDIKGSEGFNTGSNTKEDLFGVCRGTDPVTEENLIKQFAATKLDNTIESNSNTNDSGIKDIEGEGVDEETTFGDGRGTVGRGPYTVTEELTNNIKMDIKERFENLYEKILNNNKRNFSGLNPNFNNKTIILKGSYGIPTSYQHEHYI